jgi:hypothetical protein
LGGAVAALSNPDDSRRWHIRAVAGARTANAIARRHEELTRRIETKERAASADTAAMLFWALPASGRIILRKIEGWQTLAAELADRVIDLAARPDNLIPPEVASNRIFTQIATAPGASSGSRISSRVLGQRVGRVRQVHPGWNHSRADAGIGGPLASC